MVQIERRPGVRPVKRGAATKAGRSRTQCATASRHGKPSPTVGRTGRSVITSAQRGAGGAERCPRVPGRARLQPAPLRFVSTLAPYISPPPIRAADDNADDVSAPRRLASLRAPNLPADQDYLSRVYGNSIGPVTRRALARWLFKAARNSSAPLPLEIAALAANYLDRVMSAVHVGHGALQSMAAACLKLALKVSYGASAPTLEPGGVAADPRFELPILQALRWRLVVPTVFSFLPVMAALFWIPEEAVRRAGLRAEHFIIRTQSQRSREEIHPWPLCTNVFPS
jgi:Cyclin, N-terminal domain